MIDPFSVCFFFYTKNSLCKRCWFKGHN